MIRTEKLEVGMERREQLKEMSQKQNPVDMEIY